MFNIDDTLCSLSPQFKLYLTIFYIFFVVFLVYKKNNNINNNNYMFGILISLLSITIINKVYCSRLYSLPEYFS